MMITVSSHSEHNMKYVLMEMQSAGELCDFTIKSGVYSVQAHKCILAASLQYFRTSFHFSESDTQKTSIDLSHLNCEVDVIGKVVQSLYSNQIEVTEENISDILQVADYLMHNDLILGIQKFMENTLEISTAAVYFQLCLRYGFDKGHVFARICVLLSSRMHDHLLHQATFLDWGMDVMEAMLKYNLFDYCTPSQITRFVLKKLERLHFQAQLYGKEELNTTSLSILSFLEMFFTHLDKSILNKWSSNIRDCLNSWITSHSKQISDFENVQTRLATIQNSEILKNDNQHYSPGRGSSESETTACTQHSLADIPLLVPALTSFTSDTSHDKNNEPLSHAENESNSSIIPSTLHSSRAPDVKSDKPFFTTSSTSSNSQVDESDSTSSEDVGDCLVVISPSHEMVSQLMEVEVGSAKPLLRNPQLSLNFYDIGLRMWRSGGTLDFPIRGLMMEKHSWRMAYINQSLFLFSLTKRKGLEYNIESKEWLELECQDIFKPHISTEGDVSSCFPVKSVIPVSLTDSLVVLAMSREPREDRSYWTQQHIYQWEPESRTFIYVTCVQDARLNLPATKWTVDGNELVTVKASKMMFGDIQMYNIQHIHVYNAISKHLETHHLNCLLKSGMKIFLREQKLHLLDNFGEYRVYNLVTRELGNWTSLSDTPPYLSFGHPDLEIAYPAGVRSSCHGGSSRWTMNSNFNVCSASLSEVHVTENGEFLQRCHPNPPFLYMTAMCSARLNNKQRDCLDQAIFQMPTKQDQ